MGKLIGRKFRLIGRVNVFIVIANAVTCTGSPCVIGHTLNGRFQTTARIDDIIFLD